jgi:poly(A) polymerase
MNRRKRRSTVAEPGTRGFGQREFAVEVVRRLRDAGHQALFAGGSVRDLILGQIPADYDVATDATPERVMAVLPYKAITVGISFGVVRVRSPGREGLEVEVSTFRSDGAYVDGRRPQSVVFSSPELDAARRDFTINGMFFDPISETVIDYVGGQADLENRVLRAIGDPVERLREDKLRVLRAIRLAARFQFEIEPRTMAALVSMAGQLGGVSPERIAQELRKMLVHASRARAMTLAHETGVVASVLAPVAALRGQSQFAASRHDDEDRWDHTMRVLDLLPHEPSFALAMAALLHEVDEPRVADRICLDLKLSNSERERITWLVAHHKSLIAPKTLRVSALKRLLASPGIGELLALHRADALATSGDPSNVDYCESYLRDEPDGPINPPPLVTGHDLHGRGLLAGAQFAEVLERIREAQLERRLETPAEALAWVDQEIDRGALVTRAGFRPHRD